MLLWIREARQRGDLGLRIGIFGRRHADAYTYRKCDSDAHCNSYCYAKADAHSES